MTIFDRNGSGLSGQYGYNLCVAVEPPRRLFSAKKVQFPNCWTWSFSKKCVFVEKLKQISIALVHPKRRWD